MQAARKTIAQGLYGLALVCGAGAALGLAVIVIIITASVVMRKFGSPLHITEEVVGLLLSVSLFLGLPMVTLRSQNVRVSLLVDHVPAIYQVLLRALGLLLAIGFFVWLMTEILPWFDFALRRNLRTETARILLYPWMAVMPVTIGLTTVILAARLLRLVPEDGGRGSGTSAIGAGEQNK